MDEFETFILSADATFIPISKAPGRFTRRFNTEGVDYLVSRNDARSCTIALDAFGGHLVRAFVDGATLPDALRKVSATVNMPASELAEAAYPLMVRLVDENYLVRKDNDDPTQSTKPPLQTNTFFRAYRILSTLQRVDDTAVYAVELPDGTPGVLKILRKNNPPFLRRFLREQLLLEKLGGTLAPRLIEASLEGDDTFLVMERIEGIQVAEWAKRARNLPHREKYLALREMAISLLDAYIQLHQQNILHSDVHPGNIMVTKNSQIRLIDFGLAWHEPTNELLGEPERFNSPLFAAPDLASAQRDKRNSPPPSLGSEIYSLGATLYLMMTGRHYLSFSLDTEEQQQDIALKPMRSFAEVEVESWVDMETLLGEMLCKDESQRISSLDACVKRLKEMTLPEEVHERYNRDKNHDLIPFIRSYHDEVLLRPFIPPSASIFFGAAGLAYSALRAAIFLKEPQLLPDAEYMSLCARIWMNEGPEGALAPHLNMTDESFGANGLLHQSEGIAMIEALLAHTMGNAGALYHAYQRYITAIHKTRLPAEFSTGRAGLLNGVHQLSYLVAPNDELIQIGGEIASDILSELESFPKIEVSPIQFAGFAHGWAGILYPLLAWGQSYNESIINRVLPFLEQMEQFRIKSPLGAFWPCRFDQAYELGDHGSWCNGSAGFVLLWTKAFEVTHNVKWLQLAEEAGRHAALHPHKGASLCCGLPGRTFALAHLYRATGSQEWIDYASRCVERAEVKEETHIHSLFQGIPGWEIARVELLNPDKMVFPTLASDQYGPALSILANDSISRQR